MATSQWCGFLWVRKCVKNAAFLLRLPPRVSPLRLGNFNARILNLSSELYTTEYIVEIGPKIGTIFVFQIPWPSSIPWSMSR